MTHLRNASGGYLNHPVTGKPWAPGEVIAADIPSNLVVQRIALGLYAEADPPEKPRRRKKVAAKPAEPPAEKKSAGGGGAMTAQSLESVLR